MTDYFDNIAWKNERLGKFTASEIYRLFQTSTDKSKHFGDDAELYIRTKAAELLTMSPKADVNAKQLEWGHMYEHIAYQYFEKVTGKTGIYYGSGNPKFFAYGEDAGCSPDWEIEGEEGGEIKCPYDSSEHARNLLIKNAEEFKRVRKKYWYQIQFSMMVRQWKRAHFISFDDRMIEEHLKMKIITLPPDYDWQVRAKKRLDLAIAQKVEILQTLQSILSLPATYDPSVNATIVEQ